MVEEKIKIGASIGNRGGAAKEGLPGVLSITIGIEHQDLFDRVVKTAEMLKQKGKADFGLGEFSDSKMVMVDFGKYDTIRPFMDLLRGHDLVEDFHGHLSAAKTSIDVLRLQASNQINLGRGFSRG